ncbi:MAG: hypothetical protein WD230_08710, partial [Cucumibacter sp.]
HHWTNIRFGSLESEVIETETPSAVETEAPAELAEPTGNTEEDQPLPEKTETATPAPTLESAPEPEPRPEPQPEPQPVAEPEQATPPPPPEPEPVPVEAPQAVEEAPVLAAPADEAPQEIAPVPPPANLNVAAARQRFAEAQAAEEAREAAERQAREDAERQRQAELQANPEPDQISDIINNEESRGATTGAGGTPTAAGRPERRRC